MDWKEGDVIDGIVQYDLPDWESFHRFIQREMLDFPNYVWRGQRSEKWPLRTSFDRLCDEVKRPHSTHLARELLDHFKYASRGRRGPHPASLNEDAWWSLGQHHGLATPLLDWTHSAYVAAYFAFLEPALGQTEARAIYALHQAGIVSKGEDLQKAGTSADKLVRIVRPLSDENWRLINQNALFTYIPPGTNLDDWVRAQFPAYERMILIKVTVPSAERESCLRNLRSMNITHLSLFPDLDGAAKYCNVSTQVKNYV